MLLTQPINLWIAWAKQFFDELFHFFDELTFTVFGGTFYWSHLFYGIVGLCLVITIIAIIVRILTW